MVYHDELLVDKPVISVCVPTYNQEKYISETLDSILSQLIDVPYEIIIADDCSFDSTLKICLEYQKNYPERIILIKNEQNKGLLKNLFDVLYTNARGKYIALCAGDDVWVNRTKLKKQFEKLDSNDNFSMVHTGYNKFYESANKFIPTIGHWESPLLKLHGKEAIKDVVLEHFNFFPLGSSTMFRKTTIDKYRKEYSNLIYDKDAPGEALIAYSFFALDGIFEFIPEVMVNYRIREESMCHIVDRNKELIFNIKFRILQKTLIINTFLDDKYLIKRVNRTFLSLYLESIKNNCEETFFNQYNLYKKDNGANIPFYVKFAVSFFSMNTFHKFIYKTFFGILLKLKNARSSNVLNKKNNLFSFI